jgi:DNA replication protein DnaC
MAHISETLFLPEKVGPVDCVCQDCGKTFQGMLYKYPVKVPKSNYPQAFDITWTERILGGPRCPACWEKKKQEDEKAAEEARIAAFAGRRRAARLTCGIPEKYQNEDFSTFDLTGYRERFKSVFDKTWKYAENFPLAECGKGYRSMVLYSEESWGVGKTHLACAIAHRVLDRWTGVPSFVPVRVVSEYDLLMQIIETYSFSQEEKQYRESETDIIRHLIFTPLLIIDDVGKRKVADLRFVQRIHFAIINGRYNNMRPIILTANLDMEALGRYLGGVNPDRESAEGADEASLDRLAEMCGGVFTRIDGKSYRRNKPGTARGKGAGDESNNKSQ